MITQVKEYCPCETPEGKSKCADCETKINLAEEAGLIHVGWEDGKPEFMGNERAWQRFENFIEGEGRKVANEIQEHDCKNGEDDACDCTILKF